MMGCQYPFCGFEWSHGVVGPVRFPSRISRFQANFTVLNTEKELTETAALVDDAGSYKRWLVKIRLSRSFFSSRADTAYAPSRMKKGAKRATKPIPKRKPAIIDKGMKKCKDEGMQRCEDEGMKKCEDECSNAAA